MRAWVNGVLVVVFVACGGQSLSRDGADDGGGGRGGSQSPNGGSGPSGGAAGVSGSGGTAVTSGSGGTLVTGGVGGTLVTGGAGGTTVTGGAGGSAGLAAECAFPIDSGPCEGAEPSYAFDAQSGLCVPFYYGGCEGNANRFESAEACYRMCDEPAPGGPADCTSSAVCLATSTECCACEGAAWHNVVGVNTSNVAIVSRTKCSTVDCQPCTPDGSMAWMGATCREGHCVAYDARQTDMVECTTTTDCSLRYGLGCCESCTGDWVNLVALSNENWDYLCPEGHPPCPPCAGQRIYPDGAYAVCESGGCVVTDGI